MSGWDFRDLGGFSKVLGRLKLRHRKFQTAFTGFFIKNGGSGEIRTHGGLSTLDGFQDRCIKPLCHASILEAVILMELTAFAKRYFRKNI